MELTLKADPNFWANTSEYFEDGVYSIDRVVQIYGQTVGLGWSIKTQKCTASMMRSMTPILETVGFDSPRVYKELESQGKSPYTIKVYFTLLSKFYQFLKDAGFLPPKTKGNPFKTYMTQNRVKKFKHVYHREEGIIPLEVATQRILNIDNELAKRHALFLLQSGLRLDESYNVKQGAVEGTFIVAGKGGKVRRVYVNPPEALCPKHILYKVLGDLNLKPHTLRKLCATYLASTGASHADLMKVMGWSKIETASYYLQARSDERLKELMNVPIAY